MVVQRLRDIPKEIARGDYSDGSKFHKGRQGVVGQAAANHAIRTFKILYNFAAESSPLPLHTVQLKKKFFPEKPRDVVIPDPKLPEFYRAAEQLMVSVARDAMLFLLFSGARVGETVKMKWKFLNFDRRSITLPPEDTKTGKPLDMPMTDMLRFILLRRRNEHLAKVGTIHDDGFVFVANSKTGHLDGLSSPLETIKRRIGISDLRVHDLRRTFGTIGGEVVGKDRVGQLLNHKPQGVTGKHYAQTRIEAMREPAQQICNRIRELCDVPAPDFHMQVAASSR